MLQLPSLSPWPIDPGALLSAGQPTPRELDESTEAPTVPPETTTQLVDTAIHGTQEIFATPTSISDPIELVTETPAINSLPPFSPSPDPVSTGVRRLLVGL